MYIKMKYSIIMLVNNITNLEKSIQSILTQKYDLENLELYLIDITENGLAKKEISKIQEKITTEHVRTETDKLVSTYNKVLNKVKGDIVSFITSSNYYESNKTFSEVDKCIKKCPLVSIKSKYFDNDKNILVDYKINPLDTALINLTETPFLLSLNFNSYFLSKELLKGFTFIGDNIENAEMAFLMEVLRKHPKYFFLNSVSLVSYSPFETNSSKYSQQYDKSWYTESIKYFIDCAEKLSNVPSFLQEIFLYVIYTRINCNIYDRNKDVLSKEEVEEFFETIIKLAQYIDNQVIIGHSHHENLLFRLPRWIRYYIINKKLGNKEQIDIENNKIIMKYKGNQSISNDDILSENVKIFAINYANNTLSFDCSTSLKDMLEETEFKIYAKYNNQKIETTKTYFYPLLKAFGVTLAEKYCFHFDVDISDRNGDIEVYAVINGKEFPLDFSYAKVQARLNDSNRSFWHYKDFVLHNRVNKILVRKAKVLSLLKSEILFDISKFMSVKNKVRALKLIGMRMCYYLTKPFYKNKHVWLTWDKLYKAGDNGEYIYQYCLKQHRNIYYFIKKDAPDYHRLKNQNKKRCVVFNSLKAKMLSLHSEVILDTHANVISYCGFDGMARHFVSGLFNPEIICIQHGLTIQDIAQYQNRLFDNIKYYCCASQVEIDNITKPIYDYRENQICLTGLARYDGLVSKEEKLILITPTWRRNVVNSNIAYVKKNHNDNFKHSDYFTIYNSLINNKELIACAKKYGYKLIYLLHPAMSGQLEDFDRNDFVDIVAATGNVNYEDILTRSALMVTDYSGVQFDFAYQRKALIYYHPDSLPPHYDTGALNYETMGFGPICKNEKQIVEELCMNMKNGCKINPIYKKRADDFFAYDDYNNCERIVEAVDKYIEKS